MHARSTYYRVKPDQYEAFLDAISQSVPLMRQQKGFHSMCVMRTAGSNPPDVRVMTMWETQQALQDSERNVYFYQAVTRALAFSQGFPRIVEEEVAISDFPD